MEPETIVYGISTLAFVAISILVGALFLRKYFQVRRSEKVRWTASFFWIGAAWTLLTSSWWGSVFSFLTSGTGLYSTSAHLFLSNFFLPIAVVFWFEALSHLMDLGKRAVWAAGGVALALDVTIVIFLAVDPALLGTVVSPSYWRGTPFTITVQMLALVTFVLTGFWFTVTSYKRRSGLAGVKEKTAFLIYSFSAFFVASVFDSVFLLDPLALVAVRILLATTAIASYLGFFYKRGS
jgi:hypothetical protein